jgi:hypothetical protein
MHTETYERAFRRAARNKLGYEYLSDRKVTGKKKAVRKTVVPVFYV